MKRRRFLLPVLAATLLLVAGGCVHLSQVQPTPRPKVYQAQGEAKALVKRFVPAFLVHNYGQAYNRIGRPVASRDDTGQEVISMDTSRPAVYWRVVKFQTAKGSYTSSHPISSN